MKFNLLSDLHLERDPRNYYRYEFPATAPHLILAGDIGNVVDRGFEHFLLRAALSYLMVVFILGNHEPWGTTLPSAIARCKEISAKAPNLKFLENDMTTIDDTLILGTTLYSYISEEILPSIRRRMADFRYVRDWTTPLYQKAFSDSVDWLENATKGEKILVVTHYAPVIVGSSHPKYANTLFNSAFGTDLNDRVFWPRVTAWVYGHTHYNPESRTIDGVKLLTNMRGYEHEMVSNFNASKVFEV